MAMVVCDAGDHPPYDDNLHRECPYCRKVTGLFNTGSPGAVQGHGPGPTGEVGPPPLGSLHYTSDVGESRGKNQRENLKTRAVVDENDGTFDPVVGWLVVVSPEQRGQDYRIRDGMNSIGRAKQSKIWISFDSTVSQETHAQVVYDRLNHRYFIKSVSNTAYLNGEIVLEPKALSPYDKITVGKTILVFVPLCGPEFSWDSSEAKE